MKSFEIPMVVMSLLGFCFLSGLDAPPAQADFVFGTPTNLGPKVNTSAQDDSPTMPADGLSLFFCSTRLQGYPDYDLYVMTRETVEADWSAPVSLGSPLSTPSFDCAPNISANGLTLVFASDRPGGLGGVGVDDLWMATRQTKEDPWGVPVNLGPVVNSPNEELSQCLSADTLELYFGSDRPGGHGNIDLWVTRRVTPQSAWGPPVNLGPTVNSPYDDGCSALSANGLCLVFTSARPGGYGGRDIWVTTRASKNDPWRTPWNPGPPLNTSYWDQGAIFSPDGSTIYFCSTRPGGYGLFDLWRVPILPIVDFNGDFVVDIEDLIVFIELWGQADPLCDIGPYAWGDGKVDANDLAVLMSHWGEEIGLIAKWALDETEGTTAADSAGDNDATVLGDAAWQPEGKIGGALAFDGKDDFAQSQKPVLDPAKGPLSVLAWVKGTVIARVILSQAGMADWLYVNPFGMLATDLKASGRSGTSLTSGANLLDDQWHHVALVWDGTNRSLYVDGVEVATDTQPNLAPSSGNLQIGCSKGGGAFWSGLIDDVRIYNRAVAP